jgi:hypothetical protein
MLLTPEKFAEITAKVEARMKRTKPPPRTSAEYRWIAHQSTMTEERRQNAINSVLSRCLAEKAREQINREKGPRQC